MPGIMMPPGFRSEWDILLVLNLLTVWKKKKTSQRNRIQGKTLCVGGVDHITIASEQTLGGRGVMKQWIQPKLKLPRIMELGTQIAWSWSWNSLKTLGAGCAATMENGRRVFKNLEMELPYDPLFPFLGIYPNAPLCYCNIAKIWKQPT